MTDLLPESIIGAYRVIRQLGKGGMGAVYEVEHATLGVHYALKTFILDQGHEDFLRDRFLAEGRALARLNHPNLVRVFDLGIDSATGVLYFVMDLVLYKDGFPYTLADLDEGGADEEHLVRWFGQLVSALEYVHAQGIVHRDIKLNNILLNDHGGVTLSDFGVSRFFGEKMRSAINVQNTMSVVATGERLVMGTAGFMAPEVERGEEATPAADYYSLGMVFYRLLTGMWYEENATARGLLDDFEYNWNELVPRMLSADPAKRVVELPRRKAEFAAADDMRGGAAPRRPRHRRVPVILICSIAAAIATIAVAAWFWLSRPTEIDEDKFFEDSISIPSTTD